MLEQVGAEVKGIAALQSSLEGGGIGSVIQILKFQLADVPETVEVVNTLTR